jgi:putative effector of murein hydrolase
MKQYIPYFLLAILMVAFGKYFKYPGIVAELIINTVLMLIFIGYAQYKDKLLSVFLSRTRK